MMKATRRGVLAGGLIGGMAGVLAVPTVAGLAPYRWQHGEGSVLLHDPALTAGRQFAGAVAQRGGQAVALEGDRIRLAQQLLAQRPAMIAGVSLGADALLIEEAATEAGYRPVAALMGSADACRTAECQPGWQALGRLADSAGASWIEALADFAMRPTGTAASAFVPSASAAVRAAVSNAVADAGHGVIGWVLAPRK